MSKTDRRKKSRSKSKPLGAPAAFLLKTYEILENPLYENIACWNKEGNAFIVKNVTEFSDKILPKYFKHNNFASFVRQLNMYDFHKSRQENNENEFCHKLFKRGQKHLLSEIKRKTTESQNYESNQLVPMTRELDFDKFKKEAGQFSNELKALKNRQSDLEKITKVIFGQNTKLLKENKILWNELIKNKEKYERKIEKLMLFIFSLMQYSGNNAKNALSFENKKGLAQDFSDTININGMGIEQEAIQSDQEDNNTTLSVLPEKKNHEKFFNKISKYFQSKGSKTTLDKLLDMAQKGSLQQFLNNQANLFEDHQTENDLDFDLANSNLDLSERIRKQRPSKLRRNPPSHINDFSDELLKDQPSKFIKLEHDNRTDSEKMLHLKNNHDLPNLELPIGASNIEPSFDFDNIDQPAPFKNLNSNSLMPTSLIPYPGPPIGNYDYLTNSPKLIFNMSQEDPETPMDKDLFNFEPKPKNNMEDGIGCFSPSSFMNNSESFGYKQPLDDSFERNE